MPAATNSDAVGSNIVQNSASVDSNTETIMLKAVSLSKVTFVPLISPALFEIHSKVIAGMPPFRPIIAVLPVRLVEKSKFSIGFFEIKKLPSFFVSCPNTTGWFVLPAAST